MRIGVIGDIHGDASALAEVLGVLSNHRIDMLLLVGDIGSDILPPGFYTTDFSNSFPRGHQIAHETLKHMWQSSVLCIEKLVTSLEVPVYLVPGNHDLTDYPTANTKLVFNCDRHLAEAGGIQIRGWGGAHRTPLNWPYEWSDSQSEKAWRELGLPEVSRPWVLLSHSPPYPRPGRIGEWLRYPISSFVRNLIEQTSPSVCVCGHIHSEYSIKRLGQTLVVNAGSINKELRYADSILVSSGEHAGCQATLLNCSDNLEEIEVISIFIPLRNPLMPNIKKEMHHLQPESATR